MTEVPAKGRAPSDLQGWRERWEGAGPRPGSSRGIREHRRGPKRGLGVAESCPPKDLNKHNGLLLPATIATLATPFLLPSPAKDPQWEAAGNQGRAHE